MDDIDKLLEGVDDTPSPSDQAAGELLDIAADIEDIAAGLSTDTPDPDLNNIDALLSDESAPDATPPVAEEPKEVPPTTEPVTEEKTDLEVIKEKMAQVDEDLKLLDQ